MTDSDVLNYFSTLAYEAAGSLLAKAQAAYSARPKPPPGRKQVTPAPGSSTKVESSTDYLCGAGIFTFTGTVGLTDFAIKGQGAATTIFAPAGQSALALSNCNNCTVDNVRVASAVVNGVPQGSFGRWSGTGNTLSRCILGPLNEGLTLDGAVNTTITTLSTETAACVRGQCVLVLDAKGGTASDWNLLGCKVESPLRATDKAGLVNWQFANIKIGQPAGNGKACVTIRSGANVTFTNITCTGANFSIRTGGAEAGSTPTTITNVTVNNLTINNGKIEVGDGATNIHFNNFNVTDPSGECVSITRSAGQPPVTGITFNNGVTHSTGHPGVKLYGDSHDDTTRPGMKLIAAGIDVIATNCVHTSPGKTFVTAGDNGGVSLGSGNKMVSAK